MTYELWCTDTAWTRQGHAIDTVGTRILHIKSQVSDTIRHNTLPILKYPCIIADNHISAQSSKLTIQDQYTKSEFIFQCSFTLFSAVISTALLLGVKTKMLAIWLDLPQYVGACFASPITFFFPNFFLIWTELRSLFSSFLSKNNQSTGQPS